MNGLFEHFIRVASAAAELPQELMGQLQDLHEEVDYAKGDHWIRSGIRNPDVLFLAQGAAMSYRKTGKTEQVTTLWCVGDVVIEGSILFPKRHKDDRLVFLQDSKAIQVPIKRLLSMPHTGEQARSLAERWVMERVRHLEAKYHLMHFAPPEVRLEETLKKMGEPFGLLTSAQKASYLGISKTTFYRMDEASR